MKLKEKKKTNRLKQVEDVVQKEREQDNNTSILFLIVKTLLAILFLPLIIFIGILIAILTLLNNNDGYYD